MRRLARHLFTFCSAVSLLLCVGMCVLWVRSYWRTDIAFVYRRYHDSWPIIHAPQDHLRSGRGGVQFWHRAIVERVSTGPGRK
jgi:hypothetical protein